MTINSGCVSYQETRYPIAVLLRPAAEAIACHTRDALPTSAAIGGRGNT